MHDLIQVTTHKNLLLLISLKKETETDFILSLPWENVAIVTASDASEMARFLQMRPDVKFIPVESDPVLGMKTEDIYLAMNELGWEPDVIFTCDEAFVEASAAIKDWFYGTDELETVIAARNKARFREACNRVDGGIHIISCDITEAGADFPVPCIVKPRTGAGSKGVSLILTKEELRSYEPCYDVPYQIEEFVPGQEVDVDIVLQHGVVIYAGVMDNKPTILPYFREEGCLLPSVLPKEAVDKLKMYCLDVLEDIGVCDGNIHFECKWNGAPFGIEANLRMGGAETRAMHFMHNGTDLLKLGLLVACGVELEPVSAENNLFCESTNLYPPNNGFVVSVEKPANTKTRISFVSAKVGSAVKTSPADFGIIGWAVGGAESRAGAEEALIALQNSIKILTRNQ